MKKILLPFLISCVTTVGAWAGNPERRGQAGASELLINPWAASSGWAGANSGSITGVEALMFNVGGLSKINRTELSLTNMQYLVGADISINAIGLAQRMSETGVLGVSLMGVNWGEFERTTTDDPDNLSGATFSPQFFNLSVAYSQVFSNSISGGVLVKVVSQSIDNVNATGVVLDAGVQYVTGVREQFKFGVSLRNVGPKMRYQGDGLSFRSQNQLPSFDFAADRRSEGFEMPAQLLIGAAYDFDIGAMHRLTAAANFTSNTFTRDVYQLGAEYAFQELFMVRGGYYFQSDNFDEQSYTNALYGPAAGLTAMVPLSKSQPERMLAIDYAYTATRIFSGTHSIGLRLML